MPEIPQGLERTHRWLPNQAAVDVAVATERYMDVDDNIDRYLVRCQTLDKKPSSTEWLMWLLDDDAKAKRADAAESRRDTRGDTDELGVPLTWRKR